jgi:hypothetical protein
MKKPFSNNIKNRGQMSLKNMIKHRQKPGSNIIKHILNNHQKPWSTIININTSTSIYFWAQITVGGIRKIAKRFCLKTWAGDERQSSREDKRKTDGTPHVLRGGQTSVRGQTTSNNSKMLNIVYRRIRNERCMCLYMLPWITTN